LRVLYISQYFPPEMGAPAGRVWGFSRLWAQRGREVTVLTAFPHHPTGVVPRRYQRKRLARERADGVSVVRTWIYPAANRGVAKRILSYLSFMVSAIFTGVFVVRPHDVIVASSPQFFVGVAGWVLSALGRGKFVFEIRDLWPDSVVAVGAIKREGIIRPLKRLEYFLYRRADHLVVVTESTKRVLVEGGICAEKISVVTNGVDVSVFAPGEEEELRRRLDVHDKFVISYIGTIGMAHGLEVVLRAGQKLRDLGDTDVVFLIIGEGARKQQLDDQRRRLGLGNVRFIGQRPREQIPALLRASNACLVHLRAAELFTTVIPSKIFEIMGCGRPILMGVGGEAASIVESAGAGVAFESEDGDQLVALVRKLRNDKELLSRMGKAGRELVVSEYGQDALARRYIELLERL